MLVKTWYAGGVHNEHLHPVKAITTGEAAKVPGTSVCLGMSEEGTTSDND